MGNFNVHTSSQAGQPFLGTKRQRVELPKAQTTQPKQSATRTGDHVDTSAPRQQPRLLRQTSNTDAMRQPNPFASGVKTKLTQPFQFTAGAQPQPAQGLANQGLKASEELPKEAQKDETRQEPPVTQQTQQAEAKETPQAEQHNVQADDQRQDQGGGDGQGGDAEGQQQNSGDHGQGTAPAQDAAPQGATHQDAQDLNTAGPRSDQDGKSGGWIQPQRPPHLTYEVVGYGDLDARVRMRKNKRSGEYTIAYTSPDRKETREYTVTMGDPGKENHSPEQLACYLGMLIELAYTKNKDFQSATFSQKPQDGPVTAQQVVLTVDDTGHKKSTPEDWAIKDSVLIPTAPDQKAKVAYEDELKAILDGIATLLGQKAKKQYAYVKQNPTEANQQK